MEKIAGCLQALQSSVDGALAGLTEGEMTEEQRREAAHRLDGAFLAVMGAEREFGSFYERKDREIVLPFRDSASKVALKAEELAAEAKTIANEIASLQERSASRPAVAGIADFAGSDHAIEPSVLLEQAMKESKECEEALEALKKRKRDAVSDGARKSRVFDDAAKIAASALKEKEALTQDMRVIDYRDGLRTASMVDLPHPLYIIVAQARALSGVFGWRLEVEARDAGEDELPLRDPREGSSSLPFGLAKAAEGGGESKSWRQEGEASERLGERESNSRWMAGRSDRDQRDEESSSRVHTERERKTVKVVTISLSFDDVGDNGRCLRLSFAYDYVASLLFVRATIRKTDDGNENEGAGEEIVTDRLGSLDKDSVDVRSSGLPSATLSLEYTEGGKGKKWAEWGRPFRWVQSLGGVFVFPYFGEKRQSSSSLSLTLKAAASALSLPDPEEGIQKSESV